MKFSEKEVKEGSGLASISYVFFLGAIIMAFEKENKFVVFHAAHSLVLFIVELFLWVLGFVLHVKAVALVGSLVFFVGSLFGILCGLFGKAVQLPFSGKIVNLFERKR